MIKALAVFLGSFGVAGIAIYICLLIAGICGYVMNLYKLVMAVTTPGVEASVLLVARALGIFYGPFGAILGYF